MTGAHAASGSFRARSTGVGTGGTPMHPRHNQQQLGAQLSNSNVSACRWRVHGSGPSTKRQGAAAGGSVRAEGGSRVPELSTQPLHTRRQLCSNLPCIMCKHAPPHFSSLTRVTNIGVLSPVQHCLPCARCTQLRDVASPPCCAASLRRSELPPMQYTTLCRRAPPSALPMQQQGTAAMVRSSGNNHLKGELLACQVPSCNQTDRPTHVPTRLSAVQAWLDYAVAAHAYWHATL